MVFVITLIPWITSAITLSLMVYLHQFLQLYIEWFKQHPIQGSFSFGALYFIWLPFFLPRLLLTVAGGYIFAFSFGAIKGTIFCFVAIIVAEPVAILMVFYIGRSCFYNLI